MMRSCTLVVLCSTALLLAPAQSATQLRGLQYIDNDPQVPVCPANQQFLPEVQFGCPASCDQPIPLCKAAIGPGCGCPEGTVIAGSSRPRNPERCISPKRCAVQPLPAPTCPVGEPLEGAFCGRGGSPCPTGFTCNIDPLDRFAVCCRDGDVPPPPPSKCFVSGCSGEICTDIPDLVSICIAPTCEVSCLTKFGTCSSVSSSIYDKGTTTCGWDTSAVEADYQACLAACSTDV